jgi:hypothetical protein
MGHAGVIGAIQMEVYVCQFAGYDTDWYMACLAESRRQAVTKFWADPECGADMARYSWQVGRMADLRPDLVADEMYVRFARQGTWRRLVAADVKV